MPRYLMEIQASGTSLATHTPHLAEERFPEVAVERRYSVHDEKGNREIWICRAPSESHLRRWMTAAALPVERLEHVDAGGKQGPGP